MAIDIACLVDEDLKHCGYGGYIFLWVWQLQTISMQS